MLSNTGWIGKKLVTVINDMGHKVIPAQSRLENRKKISKELYEVKPDYIINAVALSAHQMLTGRKTIHKKLFAQIFSAHLI